MYTVQVKAIGGWTVHSEHDDLDDAIDQADLIGGREVWMTLPDSVLPIERPDENGNID